MQPKSTSEHLRAPPQFKLAGAAYFHQGVRRVAFKGIWLKIFTFPISIRGYENHLYLDKGDHRVAAQLITFNPGTLENSLTLLVASGRFKLNACAAMSMSRTPITLPRFSSRARIFPYVRAASWSKSRITRGRRNCSSASWFCEG